MADAPAPPPGWFVLLEGVGQEVLADAQHEHDLGTSVSAIGARLRANNVAVELVAAVCAQLELRERARLKFGPLARDMLLTPAGLEQATRRPVAQRHADRFARAGTRRVADLGCGIGAESIAFLEASLEPFAVDIDPLTAGFAAHNLAQAASSRTAPQVTCADATAVDLETVNAAFFDPARRTPGTRDTRRLTRPQDYAPPLDFAFHVASRMPTGIKLGPGFDRELIPDTAEAQWVSVDGTVVECGLWFGEASRRETGISRSALILRGGSTDSPVAHEYAAAFDAADEPVKSLGDVIYEPDGAMIRARQLGSLARELDAGPVSDGIAYLTGNQLVETPFATAFRVIDTLPMKERTLARALADRDVGRLEIKKRGVDVDPSSLRKRLKLQGDKTATLILTRSQGEHLALLCERLETDAP